MGMRFAEIQAAEAGWAETRGLEQRVLGMINSPVAQLGRRVRIHRLDTDSDRDWGEVIGTLAATHGLHM